MLKKSASVLIIMSLVLVAALVGEGIHGGADSDPNYVYGLSLYSLDEEFTAGLHDMETENQFFSFLDDPDRRAAAGGWGTDLGWKSTGGALIDMFDPNSGAFIYQTVMYGDGTFCQQKLNRWTGLAVGPPVGVCAD